MIFFFFLLPSARTRIEPLRSLLPQVRRHFDTPLLNIAAPRPHFCACVTAVLRLSGFPSPLTVLCLWFQVALP